MKKIFVTASLAAVSFHLLSQKADKLLLKDYHPVSIYKTPTANISKASFPIIDMHSHDYPKSQKEIDDWVKMLDKMNVKKTMILTYTTGKGFDSAIEKYSKYPAKFELWCGFDYTVYGTVGW